MDYQESTETREALRAAYNEVCRSYERIDDFRAKLLGFLPLVSGTGLFLLLERSETKIEDPGIARLLVPAGLFGIIVTIGLLFYELRGIQRCIRLATVGRAFEYQMGIEGRFRRWPRSLGGFINEPIATAFIYPAVLAAWTFLAAISCSLPLAIVCAIALFCAGFIAVWSFFEFLTSKEEWQRVADDVWRTHADKSEEEVRAAIKELLPSTRLKADEAEIHLMAAKMVTAMAKGHSYQVPLSRQKR